MWDRVHCPDQPNPDEGGVGDEPSLIDSTTSLHQQQQQLPSQQLASGSGSGGIGGATPVSLAAGEPQASTSQVQQQQDSDKQQKVLQAAGLTETKEESADTAPHRQVHR